MCIKYAILCQSLQQKTWYEQKYSQHKLSKAYWNLTSLDSLLTGLSMREYRTSLPPRKSRSRYSSRRTALSESWPSWPLKMDDLLVDSRSVERAEKERKLAGVTRFVVLLSLLKDRGTHFITWRVFPSISSCSHHSVWNTNMLSAFARKHGCNYLTVQHMMHLSFGVKKLSIEHWNNFQMVLLYHLLFFSYFPIYYYTTFILQLPNVTYFPWSYHNQTLFFSEPSK